MRRFVDVERDRVTRIAERDPHDVQRVAEGFVFALDRGREFLHRLLQP
jgi:hypothetical protein